MAVNEEITANILPDDALEEYTGRWFLDKNMKIALLTLLFGLVTFSFAAPAVLADAENSVITMEEVKLDRAKVRYGNASKFDVKGTAAVGTVRSTDVYDEIPAYKTIKKEGVEKGSARYNKLIGQATKAYKAALKKVAKDKSYVLIVEEGGISGYTNVTDATSDIIAAL